LLWPDQCERKEVHGLMHIFFKKELPIISPSRGTYELVMETVHQKCLLKVIHIKSAM